MNRAIMRGGRLAAWLAVLVFSGACQASNGGPPAPAAPAAPSASADQSPGASAGTSGAAAPAGRPAGGKTLLTRLDASTTGIAHQNVLPLEDMGRYLYIGAGVAAGDIDGDGLPDLYFVSETGENKLYHNLGGFKFEDITAKAGVDIRRDVAADRWKRRFPMGAHFFDYDNDGRLDLFVTAFAGANTLFRNNGDGTFSDVTEKAGLGYVGASTTAAVADYDRDGDLDLYVATYRPYADSKVYPPGSATEPEPELNYDIATQDGHSRLLPEADRFYRNNGDGTFSNVIDEIGIGQDRGWGLGAAFADVNGDGWPDLYVANDFETPDRFYLNRRDGMFQEIARSAYRHSPFASMGMDFGDVNNDGWLDIMTTDMLSPDRLRRQTQTMAAMMGTSMMDPAMSAENGAPQIMRNVLSLNNGDGTFSDIAPFAGVTATDWSWSVKFADMDLDGWQDLLVTNGFVYDAMNADLQNKIAALNKAGKTAERIELQKNQPKLQTPHMAFQNQGDLRFVNKAAEWGFDDTSIANGMALADLDGDGDLDVVVNNMNAPAGVYRNEAAGDRLKVQLKGQASNRFGLDARITIETDKGNQFRRLSSSGGFLSSHEPVAVFGLGQGIRVKKLTVDWPSGLRSVLADVPSNQPLTVTEPAGKAAIGAPPAPAPTQFEDRAAALGLGYTHAEAMFDDFKAQPLLPFRLSQFGPGVAWGDRDGDGFDDLYIAGSNGKPGGLFANQAGKAFGALPAPLAPAAGLEEQAALWWPFGAAGQGLVTSLSAVEAGDGAAQHPIARQLAPAGGALTPNAWLPPSASSGGPLAAADYNGDGVLDLFVGGRVRPAAWPLPTDSHLFKGAADGSLAAADADAPGLAGVGMVTGAEWVDVDNDTDPDLVLATEWGPVRLFLNDKGKLTDATEAAGLSKFKGWWTGLAAADFNHDGSLDLVAANVGLNTRYQATDAAPQVLYGGDMDGDGNVDIVQAEWDGGKLYPARSGEEIYRDLPGVLDKYTSYQAFAEATLEAVFGDKLAKATRLEANWLAHTVFMNDGKGHFTAKALPDAAQLTAGYGVVAADLDDDGHDDIFLVGNFEGPEEMHTGPFEGGVGSWLKGDGKGGFTAVPATQSGLAVPEDAKGLAAADFDRDGWLDLAVGLNKGPVKLFHNGGVKGRAGLVVRLQGPAANPAGIGARITVTRGDGLVMVREAQAGGSFLSQNGTLHVFGLGDAPVAAKVTVRWPDGAEKTVDAARPGEVITVAR